jgi:hypothetical protein
VLQVAADIVAAEPSAEIVVGGTAAEAAVVAGLTQSLLQRGVQLQIDPGAQTGIVVRFADRDVELDLTDGALGTLLLKRLAPRFRELVDGVGSGEP